MRHRSFDVTAKDRQMVDRARCVSLYHILAHNSAKLPCPHCYSTMMQYVNMQQVCTRLKRANCMHRSRVCVCVCVVERRLKLLGVRNFHLRHLIDKVSKLQSHSLSEVRHLRCILLSAYASYWAQIIMTIISAKGKKRKKKCIKIKTNKHLTLSYKNYLQKRSTPP